MINYQFSMNMKGLSKSRYTAFCQCPKNLWLKIYKPEEAIVEAAVQARLEQGNKVGDLAMQLFGVYKEANAKKDDGNLDLAKIDTNCNHYSIEQCNVGYRFSISE